MNSRKIACRKTKNLDFALPQMPRPQNIVLRWTYVGLICGLMFGIPGCVSGVWSVPASSDEVSSTNAEMFSPNETGGRFQPRPAAAPSASRVVMRLTTFPLVPPDRQTKGTDAGPAETVASPAKTGKPVADLDAMLPGQQSSDDVGRSASATNPILNSFPTGDLMDEIPIADSFWSDADETVLSPLKRVRLRQNGLRIGKVNLPDALADSLSPYVWESNDPGEQFLEQANVGSDTKRVARQIPMQVDVRYELPAGAPRGETMAVLVRGRDGVVGHRLDQPQFLFAVTVSPLDDDRYHVRLVPEIQHGDTQQSYVTHEMAWRVSHHRPTLRLEDLSCEFVLSEGQAILVGPTADQRGVGRQFFHAQRADQREERTVMLLQLTRGQIAANADPSDS